jgi:hypothetical protein
MGESVGERFVPVATVGDVATARLVAARLESEGIEARVHGESLGPYPMTVGAWAVTEVWVPESRLDAAREVVLASDVDAALAGEPATEGEPLPIRLLALIVAVLLLILVARALLWLF